MKFFSLAGFLRGVSALFRPAGRVTFSLLVQRESNQRESTPHIRVSLRSTSLAPLLLRGPAYKGHPWPFTPFAASMRLIPLQSNSTRPPEGTPYPGPTVLVPSIVNHGHAGTHDQLPLPSGEGWGEGIAARTIREQSSLLQTARGFHPPYEVSGAPTSRQEAERRCCAGGREAGRRARHEGTGTSLRGVPPEQCRSEGSLAAGQTRMPGALLLWLLSSWACKKKVARPGGRKTRPSDSSKNSCTYRVPDQPKTKTLKGMVLSGLRREPDVC